MITLKPKRQRSQEGFSILEVLVTILIVTGFLLGALQATVLATLIRIQARDKTESLNRVKEELELIRYEALTLDAGAPDAGACSGSTYGARLENHLKAAASPTFPATETITIDGKSYDVHRDYTPTNNTLQISYILVYNSAHPRYKSNDPYTHNASNPDLDNINITTSLSTEVMADASLSCP